MFFEITIRTGMAAAILEPLYCGVHTGYIAT